MCALIGIRHSMAGVAFQVGFSVDSSYFVCAFQSTLLVYGCWGMQHSSVHVLRARALLIAWLCCWVAAHVAVELLARGQHDF